MKNERYYSQDRNSPHWPTPPYLYNQLDHEFHFNDDPCPLHGTNGLTREWGTSTFVNPPYGDPEESLFISKAIEESKKGKIIVMLLKAATDTKRFHELILANASEIRFIKGRLRYKKEQNPPFPSMIVIFDLTRSMRTYTEVSISSFVVSDMTDYPKQRGE